MPQPRGAGKPAAYWGLLLGGSFNGETNSLDIDADAHRHDAGGATIPDTPSEPGRPAETCEPVGQLETGQITVTERDADTRHRADLAAEISDARVVMGPVSANGSGAAVTRVRHVPEIVG